MSLESQGKAIPTHVLRTYVDTLRKKNNKGRVPIETLCLRAEMKVDLWTGCKLEDDDYASAVASAKGEQVKPPISEGTLTVNGLREAAKDGETSYLVLCRQLDKYLEGGEAERRKLERSAKA